VRRLLDVHEAIFEINALVADGQQNGVA